MSETEVIEKKVMALSTEANQITVASQPEYETAGSFLRTMKSLRDEIGETFDPVVDSAHRAHKQAVAARKKHLDPVELAERIVKRKMADYAAEVDRARQAEQQRLAAEQRRILEDRRIQEAEEAAMGGDPHMVDVILSEPIDVIPPEPSIEKPTSSGISYSDRWSGETTDLMELARYVVQNPQFIRLLAPNDVAINEMARALKENLKIPGIRARCEKIMSTRTR